MRRGLVARLGWLAALIAAIWVVEAVQIVSGRWLNGMLGLVPRRIEGLDGVLAMPLLHASPAHAAANTGPLAVLGGIFALTATRGIAWVNGVIVGLGGGLVWLLGGFAIHVGASGLVFGWLGFLLARGVRDRSAVALGTAAVVGVLYGALLWGVLPGQRGVSWEAHLFGALAGVAAAWTVPCRLTRRA
ncbi:rhomboid family intramembrane serine protease [Rhodobacteraceae bacterium CCMM004]|nr:rhomboid family intramembrane serine protease [Rhodobacteraceae bacterium CCMM004]